MKIALIVGYIRMGGFQTFLINILKVLESEHIILDIYYYEISEEIKKKFPQNNYIQMAIPSFNDKIFTLLKPNVMFAYMREVFNDTKSNRFYCLYLSQLAKHSKNIYFKYDKVVSLSEHLNLYLNMNFINAKERICWIHPNYTLAEFDKRIDFKYLKFFDKIFAVSNNSSNSLKGEFPSLNSKIDCIENIIDEEYIKEKSEEIINTPYVKDGLKLLTVCRITNDSKRVDRMLKIARELEKKSFNYTWIFIGDGPDLDMCKIYIKEHKVNNVVFLGNSDNPYPYYKIADLFVLLSEYEGNPYVLKEARVFSLPYLITDFDKDLIETNKNCFGIPNNEDTVSNAVDFIISFEKCENRNVLNQSSDIDKLVSVFNKR